MNDYRPVSYTGTGSKAVVKTQAVPEGLQFADGPRAGDANRNRMLAFLGECYGLGYLPAEEYERRADVAHAAVTKADLAVLATDLPPLPAASKPRVPLRKRAAEAMDDRAARGIVHGLVASLMLTLAVGVPVAIASGSPNTWHHSAAAVFCLATAIIFGVIGFIVNLVLFILWVDG